MAATSSLIDQFRIHETDEDRRKEARILDAFSAYISRAMQVETTWQHTSPLSRQDAWLCQYGNHVALAEAKHRNVPMDRYEDFILDVQKVEAHLRRAELYHVPALLIVEWIDHIEWAILSRHRAEMKDWKRSWCQRHDRDELADFVLHHPFYIFAPIGVIHL